MSAVTGPNLSLELIGRLGDLVDLLGGLIDLLGDHASSVAVETFSSVDVAISSGVGFLLSLKMVWSPAYLCLTRTYTD